MNYTSINGSWVTREEVGVIVREHDCSVTEFFADFGEKAMYKGSEVLAWLGY